MERGATGAVHCARAHGGISVFFSDGCAFNVLVLSEDISHIITGELPATIKTVLLPFDKYIVCGVSILQHSVSMGSGAMEIFRDEYAKFLGEGRLVISSEGFMLESPRVKQRRARFEVEQSQLRAEEATCGDEPCEGMHVGVLAGLSDEERRKAVRPQLDFFVDATMKKTVVGNWVSHAPERTLPSILSAMTKSDLLGLGRRMGLPGLSKLKKAELVERLLLGFACEIEEPTEMLGNSIYTGALELGRKVYEAGGMLEMNVAIHNELPAVEWFRSIPPVLFVFEHADKVSCIMPDEDMMHIDVGDWEVAMAKRERIDHARHFAETYTYQCGIVAIDELVELYARYYPNGYTRDEFRRFLLENGPDPITSFDYWTCKGVRHLVCYELVDEREVIDGFADIDGDRIAHLSEMELFRRYLFDRHAQVDIWEVQGRSATVIEGYFFEDGLEKLPSHRALQDFLDRHVPDGESDLSFVNGMIRNLVEMARLEYAPAEIIGAVQDSGLVMDSMPKMTRLLNLVMDFINDIPIWGNNGWSPAELYRRETGEEADGIGVSGGRSGKRSSTMRAANRERLVVTSRARAAVGRNTCAVVGGRGVPGTGHTIRSEHQHSPCFSPRTSKAWKTGFTWEFCDYMQTTRDASLCHPIKRAGDFDDLGNDMLEFLTGCKHSTTQNLQPCNRRRLAI